MDIMTAIAKLETIFDYRFKKTKNVESVLNYFKKNGDNVNEQAVGRFEFIGDAILKQVIVKAVARSLPYCDSKFCHFHVMHLISNDYLKYLASYYKMDDLFLNESGKLSIPTQIADFVECLFGIISLEASSKETERVITRLYIEAFALKNPVVLHKKKKKSKR